MSDCQFKFIIIIIIIIIINTSSLVDDLKR